MLVFVPVVLVAETIAPTAHTLLFVLAVLAVVPLAALLSMQLNRSPKRRGMRSAGCSTQHWEI